MADTPTRPYRLNPNSRANLVQYRQQQPVAQAGTQPVESPTTTPTFATPDLESVVTVNQHVARQTLDGAAPASAAFLADVASGRHRVKHAAIAKVRADVAFGILDMAGLGRNSRNSLLSGDMGEMCMADLRAFIAATARALEIRNASASVQEAEIISDVPVES